MLQSSWSFILCGFNQMLLLMMMMVMLLQVLSETQTIAPAAHRRTHVVPCRDRIGR